MSVISNSKQPAVRLGAWTRQGWLLLLLLVGFWLRLTFLNGNLYYTDEYISMLAARMVAERGLPILPSGLFYDHGLLYSMLAGLFINLLGFSEQIARWPVLLAGVLTLAAYYAVARRLFNSSITGIIAVILATFDVNMIKWGVWARMYALAHLFVLLSVAWLFLSMFIQPSRRGRYLSLLFLAGALFSHSLTFLLLPVLAVLLFALTLGYSRRWLQSSQLWLQGVIAIMIIVAALLVVSQGHVGTTISLQDRGEEAISMPAALKFLEGFFLLDIDMSNSLDLFDFFQVPAYNWLLFVIGLALLVTLYRLIRRTPTSADIAFLFVLLVPVLVIFELGTLLTEEWRQSRYMNFLTLPTFLLISAASLSRLLQGAAYVGVELNWLPRSRQQVAVSIPLVAALLIGAVWGRAAWDIAHARATGTYNTAYKYVRQNWQPGDRIMAEQPAAAYLYMRQADYYLNQVSAKVLFDDEEGEFAPIDRWTGSPLVDTVERFNSVLAEGYRTWLIVSDKHLNFYYDPFLKQQIFAQMDYVYQAGSKYVFLSRPHPTSLPAEPMAMLDGNFNHNIILAGYYFDPATITPDGRVSLALYWRPIGSPPQRPFKVFVQLRNGQGELVAQADHFIYEGLFDARQWNALQAQGEWLRDTADLQLPLPLPSKTDPYRIYVGFYDPETFERLPVVNDTSGENAVVIDLPPFG